MNQETQSPTTESAIHPLERAKALLEQLIQTYPAAFFPGGVKRIHPLKIGIYKDLSPVSKGWGYEPNELKFALKYYTRPMRYQMALLKAPHRIDLLGEPAGEITAAHRQVAQEKVNEIMAKRKQRQNERPPAPSRDRRQEAKANRYLNEQVLATLQEKLSTKALP